MTAPPETHFDGKVAQKAVIEKAGHVLVMRDPRETEERWEIPGGRLNEGEDVRDGLAREVKEEMGIDIIVGDVIHLEQFYQYSEARNALMIAYKAVMQDETQQFSLDDREVCEIRWVSKDELQALDFFPEYQRTLELYFHSV